MKQHPNIKFPDIDPEIIKKIRTELKKYNEPYKIDSISPVNNSYYVTTNGSYYIFDSNIHLQEYSQCERCQ
jgi:hypothetical protein